MISVLKTVRALSNMPRTWYQTDALEVRVQIKPATGHTREIKTLHEELQYERPSLHNLWCTVYTRLYHQIRYRTLAC